MKRTAGVWMVAMVLCLMPVFALAGDGGPLVEKTCAACHDLARVKAAYGVKDKAAWTVTVDRMLAKKKAPVVSQEEHTAIIEWLSGQKKQ
ncbi:MAG: hypothetical protein GXY42_06405 [Desulfovibrionales bacterium]|nr:hypothetical protein [Desulfovibrionales bacterium]